MISTEHLVPYLVASIAIIFAPGPSVLFTVARAVAWGRLVATLTVLGNAVGMLRWQQLGEHNQMNALAAIAPAAHAGVSPQQAIEALSDFSGVKRRMERRGTVQGVTVYDDFAHHPTAVAETLAGLRAAHPESRIWAVFEPRSASSCRRV